MALVTSAVFNLRICYLNHSFSDNARGPHCFKSARKLGTGDLSHGSCTCVPWLQIGGNYDITLLWQSRAQCTSSGAQWQSPGICWSTFNARTVCCWSTLYVRTVCCCSNSETYCLKWVSSIMVSKDAHSVPSQSLQYLKYFLNFGKAAITRASLRRPFFFSNLHHMLYFILAKLFSSVTLRSVLPSSGHSTRSTLCPKFLFFWGSKHSCCYFIFLLSSAPKMWFPDRVRQV